MGEGLVKKVGSKEFKELIATGVTLADFSAEWCAPCRMLEPILNEVAEQLGDKVQVVQVDIDQNQDVASENGVTSVPTLILFKDGKECNRSIGLKDTETLIEFVSTAG